MAEQLPDDLSLQRSSRDATGVPELLASWLSTHPDGGNEPSVEVLDGVDANGMSSETLLVDVTTTVDGVRVVDECVVRVAPAAKDFPIFAHYDLPLQHSVLARIAAAGTVPVPRVNQIEATGTVLGAPFFVMERVGGLVPPDVLPYNFGGSWVSDASPDELGRLQQSTVGAIAALHALDVDEFHDVDPARAGYEGATLIGRHLARVRHWYEFAARDAGRSALIERGLNWLATNAPLHDDSEAVLCWGDSRIGNVIYDDFTPAAVIDWEMVTLGPREFDLAWLCFAHEVFEDIAKMLELPGMPDFLRADDVVATYEALTGASIGDLTWHRVFAGIQWCVIFMRTGMRQVHFGEIPQPAAVEELFHCGPLVTRLLDEVGA